MGSQGGGRISFHQKNRSIAHRLSESIRPLLEGERTSCEEVSGGVSLSVCGKSAPGPGATCGPGKLPLLLW